MVRAAVSGALQHTPTTADPVFGLQIPSEIPNVPSNVLQPRSTWADGAAYDAQAARLADMFRKNFEKFGNVDPRIPSAGPGGTR